MSANEKVDDFLPSTPTLDSLIRKSVLSDTEAMAILLSVGEALLEKTHLIGPKTAIALTKAVTTLHANAARR